MRCYFNTYYIKLGLIIAFFFSSPLYLIHFSFNYKLLNTLSFLFATLLVMLNREKKSMFWSGFFLAIFWLWWIGLSFIYYNLPFLIPLIIIAIALFYGIIFLLISYLKYRVLILTAIVFGLPYIAPFHFNWLRLDILLPETYLYPTKFLPSAPLKIETIHTSVPQKLKWKKLYIPKEIDNNFKYIENSIEKGYDVVVLPETAFPIVITQYEEMVEKLKKLSKKIAIVTGGLSYKNNNYYNSTYLFQNGSYQIFNKHILVPFGEYIPLPCCKNFFNQLFFDGAEDYIADKSFSSYKIENVTFLNAICYEATIEKLYQNREKYIIAISNNGWFKPSIEPTLQKLIIHYLELKYNKRVYHSVNY